MDTITTVETNPKSNELDEILYDVKTKGYSKRDAGTITLLFGKNLETFFKENGLTFSVENGQFTFRKSL